MKKRNTTFTILSAIGIILILLGHLDLNILSFAGVFPYYSYHVMIFVFIAGYFYKPSDEEHVGAFMLRKARRLLLPYFIWNLIYGLIAIPMRNAGFVFAGEFNLYNLFIAPFMGGHQFGINAAAWFVPALFLLEMIDMVARKMLSLIRKDAYGTKFEWFVMIIYLAVGVAAVWLSQRGSVYDAYRLPARLMFMAPTLQFGRLYRTRLERYDITPWFLYFPLLFAMNLLLGHVHGGLAYSTVWVTGFAGTVLTPFITSLTGIALWLRIAKILSGLFGEKGEESENVKTTGASCFACKTAKGIGMHTFDIMMHHLAVFMLIKAVFGALAGSIGAFADFDAVLFKEDLYYVYVPKGAQWVKLIYLIAGIAIPVFIGGMTKWLRSEKE